jgi:hypothetical protein
LGDGRQLTPATFTFEGSSAARAPRSPWITSKQSVPWRRASSRIALRRNGSARPSNLAGLAKR